MDKQVYKMKSSRLEHIRTWCSLGTLVMTFIILHFVWGFP